MPVGQPGRAAGVGGVPAGSDAERAARPAMRIKTAVLILAARGAIAAPAARIQHSRTDQFVL